MKITKKALFVLAIVILILCANSYKVKAATVEVTTETLNLREEATTESDIIALLSEGDECEVVREDGDWYEVKYGDYTGYVSKEYVRLIGGEEESNNTTTENNVVNETTNTTTESNEQTNSVEENNGTEQVTSEEETEPTAEQNTLITGTTTAETQIKITPLIQSSVIATLQNNTDVTVINQMNGWAYIQTETVSGWVRLDVLKIEEQANSTNNDNNTNSGDNANNDDNTDNNNDNNSNNDNSQDNENNDTTSNFEERTMYTIDLVNIREEPSTNANVLMVVNPNTELKVIGEEGDWYEVETSEGNAYISKELLSETRVSTTNRGNSNRVNREETAEANTDKEAGESNDSSSNSSNNSSTSSSAKANEIVSYAKQFLGVPYVYGGASPSGFDCSGFTMYVYDKFGIEMSHGAQAQSRLGKKVSADKSSKESLLNNLEVGDLVFFLDYETMDEIGHCGIYIGDGNFIHASSGSGYCVKINSLLPGEYYNTRYCAARRVL